MWEIEKNQGIVWYKWERREIKKRESVDYFWKYKNALEKILSSNYFFYIFIQLNNWMPQLLNWIYFYFYLILIYKKITNGLLIKWTQEKTTPHDITTTTYYGVQERGVALHHKLMGKKVKIRKLATSHVFLRCFGEKQKHVDPPKICLSSLFHVCAKQEKMLVSMLFLSLMSLS